MYHVLIIPSTDWQRFLRYRELARGIEADAIPGYMLAVVAAGYRQPADPVPKENKRSYNKSPISMYKKLGQLMVFHVKTYS
jgi:hypothetical protein